MLPYTFSCNIIIFISQVFTKKYHGNSYINYKIPQYHFQLLVIQACGVRNILCIMQFFNNYF